ncbi:ATP-dependent DNA helicase, RecQ family [Chloroherpeton thalassium ATCC 35110]|uniref:ATP-dependent DNA helicase RecQ n=1 Tax=Chloroherpeton thalassium (strain ATCC 35110 / GB-78) TaxID=517418 RepID=B3QWV9_CHLT3|nr:ATP-dependent DNA helicase RecQ [Chloroherpeton thalassium]ACF13323.1 ATP-dependent DNA helicase, RecQ family [Chloroherpeton thalassium ATCC 35110]
MSVRPKVDKLEKSDELLLGKAEAILQKTFGYPHFREGQDRVILSLLKGQDSLVVMPTGQGKSLCYQIPALMQEGLTLVVSPLIALMKDQTDSLRARNYPARALNSQTPQAEIQAIFSGIYQNRLKLLFIAPERLQNEGFLSDMRQAKISLVAVDEAHCISEWGYDFRPSYQQIASQLKLIYPKTRPVMLALTATATEEILKDIAKSLALKNPFIYIGGFERASLSLSVFQLENKREKVLQILKAVPGAAIIYTMSRKLAEELSVFLKRSGISALCYHAGLGDAVRSRIQDDFFRNRCRVICATNAFGMGINKADVRAVIHLNIPETLEAYFQEAGRAGRDGRRSYATLLYSPADIERRRYLFENAHPDKKEVAACYEAIFQKCFKTGREVVRFEQESLCGEISKRTGEKILLYKLGTILGVLERHQILSHLKSDEENESLEVFLDRHDMQQWVFRQDDELEVLVFEQILRTFGETCFRRKMPFQLARFCEKGMLDEKEVLRVFRGWQAARLIDFQTKNTLLIKLLCTDGKPENLPIDWKVMEKRRKIAERKLAQMLQYVQYEKCRRNFILDYFGETRYTETCGICDNCTGRHAR